MRGRLFFLLALLLPEVPLAPLQGDLGPSWHHPLGTDGLGRDALLRLLEATARSLGFASAVALLALALGVGLSLGPGRFQGARSALRSLPPLLFLLPLAAAWSGLGWVSLGGLMALLLALQAEPPLRARFEPLRHGPAWAMDRVLGGSLLHRVRTWAPWALEQASGLFPSLWLAALWAEATLRLLGLGPGPQVDSLGLLLNQELPRLATDGTALGWASLGVVLMLVVLASKRPVEEP